MSAAFGVQYDIARGLSLNLGLNYADATARWDTTRLTDSREKKALLSARYSF